MNGIPDLSAAVWRKSSYSDGGGTNCVEVADGYPDLVPVRDSKVPEGPAVVFGVDSWASFVSGVREAV
ncbi:hypothetical protein QF026_004144 [Streptomyces aurantiacus]|uniref:DUF397 domain-containing protein n=1 Tax=Streptomyces aurantiacus TaxID=47760 RepID=UPI0027910AD7|nr:DUF397 domain-containing protein [Streptomyces aurantiacus]MDQ0775678.1 hypothetical protein [Streptomyces aurantiacus]